MRIGIISLQNTQNYGAVLQAYALEHYLYELGHKVFFINYQYYWDRELYKGIRGIIGRSPRATIAKFNYHNRKRVFEAFRNKYLNIESRKIGGQQGLIENPPVADVYICGSDQVWNPHYISATDDNAVFLNFGHDEAKRIVYAASFGVSSLEEDVVNRWKKAACRLKSVGVRENDGVFLARNIGITNAVCVPDPTLLLDIKDYDKIMCSSQKVAPTYVFSYLLGNITKQELALIDSSVKRHFNIKHIVLTPECVSWENTYKKIMSPEEWLYTIKMSQLVITNSFHGVVFSILFHRRFLVLSRNDIQASSNNRLRSLLEIVGLEKRIIDDYSIAAMLDEPIDWDSVDDLLAKYIESGVKFLADALMDASANQEI